MANKFTLETEQEGPLVVLRDGVEEGSFTISQIEELLSSGELSRWDSVVIDGRTEFLTALISTESDYAEEGSETTDEDPVQEKTVSARSKVEFGTLQIYERIKAEVQITIEKFLSPFQVNLESSDEVRSVLEDENYPKILDHICEFESGFTQKLTEVLETSSDKSIVQESLPEDLATRIREISFENSEEILGTYTIVVAQVGKTARIIRELLEEEKELQNKSPDNQKSRGNAAANGVQGGSSKLSNSEKLDRADQILSRTKLRGLEQIANYMKTVQDLPETVLAYCYEKCFSDVDYDLQRELIEETKTPITAKTAAAIELFESAATIEEGEMNIQKAQMESRRQREYSRRQHEYVTAARTLPARKLEQKPQNTGNVDKIFVATFLICIVAIIFSWMR